MTRKPNRSTPTEPSLRSEAAIPTSVARRGPRGRFRPLVSPRATMDTTAHRTRPPSRPRHRQGGSRSITRCLESACAIAASAPAVAGVPRWLRAYRGRASARSCCRAEGLTPDAPPGMRQRFLRWTDGDLQDLPVRVLAPQRGLAQAAFWNRIPTAAWGLMMAIAVCCNLLFGYSLRSKARAKLLVVLPIVISIAFMLVADIDTPRHGIVRLSPQNLTSLAESLRAQ